MTSLTTLCANTIATRAGVVSALLIATFATVVHAAPPVYSQRSASGGIVFSDAPIVNGEITRTSYQAEYGRPVASASCMGMGPVEMALRAQTYDIAIEAAAKKHKVDADLIRAVAQVESCFDSNAVSRVGAQGLMQLMPGTALELGVTNSFDAVQNINGGASYLAKMMKRFNQNHEYALAAYNAGPGAVDKHRGIPPFPETQAYVSKVLDLYSPQP